jgi:catalase
MVCLNCLPLYLRLPLPLQTENDFEFDPLDDTKVWPEDRFPLQPVGRMTLDTTLDNFFTEAEQAAFSPAAMPPGGWV